MRYLYAADNAANRKAKKKKKETKMLSFLLFS